MKKFIKELIPYVIIIVSVVLFRTFIATPVMVKGLSMYKTLDGGEMMILNKLSSIDRFDIVVISEPEDDHIIKRIIAMPGETVFCKDNTLYVNGKKIIDKYAYGETDDFSLVKLEKDEYFVLGDNREISKDSRIIGPVKEKDILGTTRFILFPFKKIGIVK